MWLSHMNNLIVWKLNLYGKTAKPIFPDIPFNENLYLRPANLSSGIIRLSGTYLGSQQVGMFKSNLSTTEHLCLKLAIM